MKLIGAYVGIFVNALAMLINMSAKNNVLCAINITFLVASIIVLKIEMDELVKTKEDEQ